MEPRDPLPAAPRAIATARRRIAARTWSLSGLVTAAVLLAACGGLATTAGPVETASTPAATPVAEAPSASATPDLHDLAIAAFVEQVTAGKMSYRVKFDGQVAASVDVLPIVGSMDVSGANFASSFTYDFDPEYPGIGKKRVQVRGVKDEGYIKRAGAAWRSIKGYDDNDSYVPFKSVGSVDDVSYLGPVEVDDKVLHKVSIPGAMLIHPNTIPYEVKKEKVDQVIMEVLLDDKGRPRIGTWKMRAQARVGPGTGQLQRLVYDLDLAFSKVGEKLSIKRP